MIYFIKKFFHLIANIHKGNSKFDFITISNFSPDEKKIKDLIQSNKTNYSSKFNQAFLKWNEYNGYALSYSTARMGFYHFMKINNIGKNDEVIINAGTCSVMVNAILKLEATPVYSDVCLETFGSSPYEIKKKISTRTKLIVAQHSFGIPCKINEILDIGMEFGIPILEDCALALGSKVNDIKVGNFGESAIFSFDHTKPLNLFSGGVLLIKSKSLYQKLKVEYEAIDNISLKKRNKIYSRMRIEKKLEGSENFYKLKLCDIFMSIKARIGIESPYFNNENVPKNLKNTYAYPSKMPEFISYVGLKSLSEKLEKTLKLRQKNLKKIVDFFDNTNLKKNIPRVYNNSNLKIEPLRFVFLIDEGFREKLSNTLNLEGIWFKNPVESTSQSLLDFNYKPGSCILSEEIGRKIVNIPLDYSESEFDLLILQLKKIFK